MEVRRNGRYTAHEVHLDIDRPEVFDSEVTGGKLWPFKVVISYQYLWSTGAWHVLHVTVLGRRNATATGGNAAKLILRRPESWPAWLHYHVLDNTPTPLADSEMTS
jgi:hypothetical protein